MTDSTGGRKRKQSICVYKGGVLRPRHLTIVYSINFIDRQLLSILQESIKADLMLSDAQRLLQALPLLCFTPLRAYPLPALPTGVIDETLSLSHLRSGVV